MPHAESHFPPTVWDGSTQSRPDPNIHHPAGPEDWKQAVIEVQAAQETVNTQIAALTHQVRKAARTTEEALTSARREGRRNRQVSVALPDLTANGTKTIGLWIPNLKATIEKIELAYLTAPASAAGTVLFNAYKRARARASLTVTNASPDGDVIYTSESLGPAGETTRVEHVDTAAGGLTVAVSTNDITIDLGGATPDSATVAAAVNGNPAAAALVQAKAGGDGTGLISTAVFANLAGGLVSTLLQTTVDHDLEAITAGVADTLLDKKLAVATRRVRAAEYVYCTIVSNNADATPGSGGALTLTYSL